MFNVQFMFLLGVLVTFDDIVQNYCKSFSFGIDIFAVMPMEILCLIAPSGVERNRLFSLLRLNRVVKFVKV